MNGQKDDKPNGLLRTHPYFVHIMLLSLRKFKGQQKTGQRLEEVLPESQ
jgi:hypothetical protein